MLDGQRLEFTENGKVFGLTISRTKIQKHVNGDVYKANTAIPLLFRFRELPTHKTFSKTLHYSYFILLSNSTINTMQYNEIQNILSHKIQELCMT